MTPELPPHCYRLLFQAIGAKDETEACLEAIRIFGAEKLKQAKYRRGVIRYGNQRTGGQWKFMPDDGFRIYIPITKSWLNCRANNNRRPKVLTGNGEGG